MLWKEHNSVVSEVDGVKQTLARSSRVDVNGWICLRLHGDPYQIGFQNGYLVSSELKDTIENFKLYVKGTYQLDWRFFCETGMRMYWPKLSDEYRSEIQGVVSGTKARHVDGVSLEDIVALNGYFDTLSYHYWLKAQEARNPTGIEGHCSAFIANGKATKDGKIVLAHNTWFPYAWAVGYNIVAVISPTKGDSFLMQTCPGCICSGTDWYINSSGLMVAETTISGMVTFDPHKTPYFVRARRAIQYSKTLDDWVRHMLDDNNGGYASSWLIGDARSGEIACLELGTQHHSLCRTYDGAFIGSNLATNEQVQSETVLDYSDNSASCAARRSRWKQLIEGNRERLNVDAAKKLIADHFDAYSSAETKNRNSICGHIELDKRGCPEWAQGPYYPAGSHDAKVTDSDLASKAEFWAHWGAPCDTPFTASSFLAQHAEFDWLRPRLKDIEPYPWTLFMNNGG